jgi:CheY-like chemotaxis protein
VPETAVFLLVEDNLDDIALLKRAFVKSRVNNPLKVVNNGPDAVDYLSGVGPYRNRREFPLPRIILLDINLPGMTGLEVLKWIRAQPNLVGIRVIMLTSSDAIRDVNEAYRLGANSFLIKPNDFDDLGEPYPSDKGILDLDRYGTTAIGSNRTHENEVTSGSVSLNGVVPEPSTFALGLVGALLSLFWRQRYSIVKE